MSLDNFFHELDQFVESAKKDAEAYVVEVVEDITTKLVEYTRIDTGRAKASYAASLHAPEYVVAYDVTPTHRISEDEAKQRALATVSEVKPFTLGDEVFVANGAPYISFLEEGGKHGGRNYDPPDKMFERVEIEYETNPNFAVIRGG
jgi:hypothetical protein